MQGSISYADWVLRHSLLGSWQAAAGCCKQLAAALQPAAEQAARQVLQQQQQQQHGGAGGVDDGQLHGADVAYCLHQVSRQYIVRQAVPAFSYVMMCSSCMMRRTAVIRRGGGGGKKKKKNYSRQEHGFWGFLRRAV
jgi:hypothetical protein